LKKFHFTVQYGENGKVQDGKIPIFQKKIPINTNQYFGLFGIDWYFLYIFWFYFPRWLTITYKLGYFVLEDYWPSAHQSMQLHLRVAKPTYTFWTQMGSMSEFDKAFFQGLSTPVK